MAVDNHHLRHWTYPSEYMKDHICEVRKMIWRHRWSSQFIYAQLKLIKQLWNQSGKKNNIQAWTGFEPMTSAILRGAVLCRAIVSWELIMLWVRNTLEMVKNVSDNSSTVNLCLQLRWSFILNWALRHLFCYKKAHGLKLYYIHYFWATDRSGQTLFHSIWRCWKKFSLLSLVGIWMLRSAIDTVSEESDERSVACQSNFLPSIRWNPVYAGFDIRSKNYCFAEPLC